MTDNEVTRTTFVRTRSELHKDADEAWCCETEAENFGPKATLALVQPHAPESVGYS